MSDDFSVQEALDRTTGITHRFYTFRRRPCIRRVLTSHLAKQMAGYALIKKDLKTVAIWLDELAEMHTAKPFHKGEHFGKGSDRKKYNIVKGLFVAALTFYGKCFSKCEGRPVKLERSQLDEKFHRLHDVFISYRHNFAAHSGSAKLEYVDVVVVFPPKPNLAGPKIYTELAQPDLLSDGDSPDVTFKELVEHVKSLVEVKLDRLNEKIIQEEILPKGFDYWIKSKK